MTSLFITGCIAFVAGYIAGRLDTLLGLLRAPSPSAPRGFSVKNNGPDQDRPRAAISIDERKVVGHIETNTLEKVTDIQLGNQTVAEDDIAASVSKLAQLKRR